MPCSPPDNKKKQYFMYISEITCQLNHWLIWLTLLNWSRLQKIFLKHLMTTGCCTFMIITANSRWIPIGNKFQLSWPISTLICSKELANLCPSSLKTRITFIDHVNWNAVWFFSSYKKIPYSFFDISNQTSLRDVTITHNIWVCNDGTYFLW